MKKSYLVEGMSCSACASLIEKTVDKTNGVKSCRVLFMKKTLEVDFDSEILTEKDLFNVVKSIGYKLLEQNGEKDMDESKRLRNRFFSSLVLLIPLMFFAIEKMLGINLTGVLTNFVIQFLFSLFIIAINIEFYIKGIKSIFARCPTMDALVFLGSFSALTYSVVVGIMALTGQSSAHLFFESSSMVLTLVTLGKWIEERAKKKTGKEVEKMLSLLPNEVCVLIDGEEKLIESASVKVGDVVVLRVGDFVCFDGVVINGIGSIDKSAITGESIPIEIYEGERVVSGSVLKSGYVLYKVLKNKEQSRFSKIIEVVKNAETTKVPAQKLADKIASIFVPVVVLLSLIAFVIWAFNGGIYLAFKYSISVLVISCPCALGLATPVAIMIAMGKSAECGVLFKDAECLQKLSKVDAVFMDKTATLTKGQPEVVAFENFSKMSDVKIKSIAFCIEDRANHPLSSAIKKFCVNTNDVCEKFEYVVGKGVIGNVNGTLYKLGNFVNNENSEKYQGKTLVIMSDINDNILAIFVIFDQLKSDSCFTVDFLREEKIKSFMITGDNRDVALETSNQLKLDGFYYDTLPERKAEIIEEKNREFFIAFVGDGINDSPALKTAEVGVAVGSGTDIAIESADVVLVNGNPSSLVDAIKISKKTVSIIKLNLFWAFIYNVLAIPIAGGALSFIGVSLTPGLASLCMCFSSFFVVQNALRIRSYKKVQTDKENSMTKIYIDGMMCMHCAGKVKEVLSSIDGVVGVEINLKKKLALVDGQFDIIVAKQKIEEAGYKFIKAK